MKKLVVDLWNGLHAIGFVAFCLIVGACMVNKAFGADTNVYPATLIDQTCTDSYDTPAHSTPPRANFGELHVTFASPAAQTSGDPDGYCDNDSYIKTGAITADATFGPFCLVEPYVGIYVFLDLDTLAPGGGTSNLQVFYVKPHDAAEFYAMGSVPSMDAEADFVYQIGSPDAAYTINGITDEMAVPLTCPFYLKLNLITATSITGELSLVVYRGEQ